MPTAFQKRSSAACVPLLSPREMNEALPVDSLRSASATSLPLTPAGSSFGPTTTKSLYMTGRRLRPKPSATNFSSATWSCTNSTSASPRRPRSSAWPVPSATTLMSMLRAALKAGSRCANSPDCSVLVVDAITMLRSCALAAIPLAATTAPMNAPTRARRWMFLKPMAVLLSKTTRLPPAGCRGRSDRSRHRPARDPFRRTARGDSGA